MKVGVVTAEFNADITDALRLGAVETLNAAGAEIVEVSVAGALELPVVAVALAAQCDAVVAIGAVIEGETDHYVHVATQTSAALMQASMQTGTPIGNAVLTVREYSHARERSLPGAGNKGAEAAEAAMRAAEVLANLAD